MDHFICGFCCHVDDHYCWDNVMSGPFDWEEEWEWENVDNSKPIVGQMSFFPPKFSFLKSSEDKNNNFSSFEDIIFKNPAYTVGELEYLAEEAEEMDAS